MTKGNIEFRVTDSSLANSWVLRITADRRIEVNEDVEVTYAAQKVLAGMWHLLHQRKWIGLTDEERNDCLVEADPCECLTGPEAEELMRCIEAKLREKNA